MNAKQLIAAVAVFAAAGSAFAQQQEFVAPDANFVSAKTRAEVVAELNQAYAQGALAIRDGADTPVLAATKRAREEVRAEAVHAKDGKFSTDSIYFGA
jgi:hypothetical protein